MEELYRAIEEKIRMSGYTGHISGKEIYDDICDQIDDKENGMYLLMSKFEDLIVLEYRLKIMNDTFNLEQIRIKAPEGEFTADFD